MEDETTLYTTWRKVRMKSVLSKPGDPVSFMAECLCESGIWCLISGLKPVYHTGSTPSTSSTGKAESKTLYRACNKVVICVMAYLVLIKGAREIQLYRCHHKTLLVLFLRFEAGSSWSLDFQTGFAGLIPENASYRFGICIGQKSRTRSVSIFVHTCLFRARGPELHWFCPNLITVLSVVFPHRNINKSNSSRS